MESPSGHLEVVGTLGVGTPAELLAGSGLVTVCAARAGGASEEARVEKRLQSEKIGRAHV